MRLPVFYPTVDGGWREFWISTVVSDGEGKKEGNVSNFLIYINLEFSIRKLKAWRPAANAGVKSIAPRP